MKWPVNTPMPNGWNFLCGFMTNPAGDNYQVLIVPAPENGPETDMDATGEEYDTDNPTLRRKG